MGNSFRDMNTVLVIISRILLCGVLHSTITSGYTAFNSTPSVPAIVTQIHIAQGRTPNSMTISWVTAISPTETHLSDPSYMNSLSERNRNKEAASSTLRDKSRLLKAKTLTAVQYGTDPSHLYMKSSGSSSSYSFNYTKLANYTSGLNHHTFLHNLLPGTTYFYQCGDFFTGSSADFSGEYLMYFWSITCRSPADDFCRLLDRALNLSAVIVRTVSIYFHHHFTSELSWISHKASKPIQSTQSCKESPHSILINVI